MKIETETCKMCNGSGKAIRIILKGKDNKGKANRVCLHPISLNYFLSKRPDFVKQKKYTVQCYACKGKGKIDWIQNALDKNVAPDKRVTSYLEYNSCGIYIKELSDL